MTQPSAAYSGATRGRFTVWTLTNRTPSAHTPALLFTLISFFTATNAGSDVSRTQRIPVINSPRHRCILGDPFPNFNKWQQRLDFLCATLNVTNDSCPLRRFICVYLPCSCGGVKAIFKITQISRSS
uniref:Uncharacterized protein n=1 Tax=Tetraodon nigroviridis TaxID=99883 RepID=H3CX39_TETNG